MPFEDELSEEFRRVGETFELSDSHAVVDGGLVAGRRGLRRRRTAAVTGSVLALALIGVGGAFAGGFIGESGTTTDVAGVRRSISPGSGSGVSGAEMVGTLQKLLPKGTVSEARGEGTDVERDRGRATASVVYDDGKGPATVSASLYLTPELKKNANGMPQCHEDAGYWANEPTGRKPDLGIVGSEDGVRSTAVQQRIMACAAPTGPDGQPVTGDGADSAADDGGVTSSRYVYLTKSGVTVDIRAYNVVLDKNAKPTRAEPPLGTDPLVALGKAEAWRGLAVRLKEAVEAADTSPAATSAASPTASAPSSDPTKPGPRERPENPAKPTAGLPTPSSLDYTRLMPTFLKLLPKGLPVVEQNPSGEGEYAYVVVDDGKGRSLVQINVQRDMRDVTGDLYSDATTLPDGTLLATSQQPGEKGGAGVVQWTADTMRPDGMRVVVSAFNSGDQASAATRSEPALTIEQLTALATSPEWLKLQK